MQDIKRNPNLKLSDGLYRFDHPDSDLFLSRPLWSASVHTLGDYYQHLCEKRDQRVESSFADQSNQPDIKFSSGNVTSTNGNSTDCNGGQHAYVDNSDDDNNNFQHICVHNPIRTCNCGNKCADIDFEPTKYAQRQDPSTWAGPCVVVGCTEQASRESIQLIPNSEHNSRHEDV